MDQTELIQAAWDSAEELKDSEPYRTMRSAWNEIVSDPLTRSLKDAFEAAKARMDSIRPYGKYHPDFKTASEALALAKTRYQQTDAYKTYVAAKAVVDDILRTLSERMNALVLPLLFESQTSCSTR